MGKDLLSEVFDGLAGGVYGCTSVSRRIIVRAMCSGGVFRVYVDGAIYGRGDLLRDAKLKLGGIRLLVEHVRNETVCRAGRCYCCMGLQFPVAG